MINFINEIDGHCRIIGAVYVEGLCDCGVMDMSGGAVTLVPNGGYRASILLNGKEVLYGFSAISHEHGVDEDVKDAARKNLLYWLIIKALKP